MSPIEKLLATPSPADLGPGPRADVLDEAAIRRELTALRPGVRDDALLALLLLWHDHHRSAHEIAQAIEDADGSYVHAILHRREPDYGNAKYWFRRVGRHAAYAELGRRVTDHLQRSGQEKLSATLVPGGRWDPLAFVDACDRAAGSRGGGETSVLREIQRIEFEVLLNHLANGQLN